MKIVIIGGTGLIGSMLRTRLQEQGHDPIPASPDTGVNAVTGEGLPEVLDRAQVVVDVANAPLWDDAAVLGSSARLRATSSPPRQSRA
jgi:nucleoside-diphosphate-sugar epimerase